MHTQLPWRNWLARSAVNRKVGGSSPPGSVLFSVLTCAILVKSAMSKWRMINHIVYSVLPWRNWLARSAVNRKVSGSSPPGSDILILIKGNLFKWHSFPILFWGRRVPFHFVLEFMGKLCDPYKRTRFPLCVSRFWHDEEIFLIYFKIIYFITSWFFTEWNKPAWRNGLARWTSNPKVVGSNPTVGVFYLLF